MRRARGCPDSIGSRLRAAITRRRRRPGRRFVCYPEAIHVFAFFIATSRRPLGTTWTPSSACEDMTRRRHRPRRCRRYFSLRHKPDATPTQPRIDPETTPPQQRNAQITTRERTAQITRRPHEFPPNDTALAIKLQNHSTDSAHGERRQRTPTNNATGQRHRTTPPDNATGQRHRTTPTDNADGQRQRTTPTDNGQRRRTTPTDNTN